MEACFWVPQLKCGRSCFPNDHEMICFSPQYTFVFFSTNSSQMCSHKCLSVAAEDSRHDKSLLRTIITAWAAQTLSNTNLQGAISQERNTFWSCWMFKFWSARQNEPTSSSSAARSTWVPMKMRLKVINLKIHQAIDEKRRQQGKRTCILRYESMNICLWHSCPLPPSCTPPSGIILLQLPMQPTITAALAQLFSRRRTERPSWHTLAIRSSTNEDTHRRALACAGQLVRLWTANGLGA